jgi:hypothetical protein
MVEEDCEGAGDCEGEVWSDIIDPGVLLILKNKRV